MIFSYILLIFSWMQTNQCLLEITNLQKCVDFEKNGWVAIQTDTRQRIEDICNSDNNKALYGTFSTFNQELIIVSNLLINLPPHEKLFINVQFSLLDALNTYYCYNSLMVDGKLKSIYSSSVYFSIQHNSLSVLIQMQTICYINITTNEIQNFSWGISSFTLQVDQTNKTQLSDFIGEETYLSALDISDNEGWLHQNSAPPQIQNLIEFSVLGSSQPNEFYQQIFFSLPILIYEIEMQFKIFSTLTIPNLDLILNYKHFTLNGLSNYIFYSFSYLTVFNLKTEIEPYYFLLIQIRSQLEIQIIGMRDFHLSYKYEKQKIRPILGCSNQIVDECWNCEDGWDFKDQFNFVCVPICGDMIITYDEECDDGNSIPYDGCHNCKFSCDLKCSNCTFGQCLDVIDYAGNENFNCKLNSYSADSGIYYDISFQTCVSMCGDGIISLNEQCDDGNNSPYDGCHLCQFQCPLYCLNCLNGNCLLCNNGFKLNNNKCESYCGNQTITYDEQCDDGNSIQLDGCNNCQFSCKQNCQDCISNNYCIKCQNGWNMNNGQCEQICNDNQLAILSIEQCDDQLDEYCIDCQIQCSIEYCILCKGVFTCLQCDKPYSLINGSCVPFCGDGMLYSSTEQCDDGNNIKNDGCYNCKFECYEGCLNCDYHLYCTQCDANSNYILDKGKCQQKALPNNEEEEQQETSEISAACAKNELLINFQCINQCGNGIIDGEFENCDDGNINGGDGCSFDCQIENFYTCKNNENQMSQCTFLPQPYLILTNLSAKRSSLQLVLITFSEEVKSRNQFTIETILKLTIIPTVETIISIKPITNLSLTSANVSYTIEIQFLQQAEQPQLIVEIMKSTIFSAQEQQLKEENKSVSLGEPFILSKSIQLKVDQITEVNNAIIYSMMGIAFVAILTGNFALLLNLIDLLQQLSYLRYVQYQFPSHLKQFLDTYTKISLQPLLDKLQIDEFISKLNGGRIPFLGKKSNKSIELNQVNQYYLLNAKSCYFSFFLSFTTYLLCCFIVSDRFQGFITKRFLLNCQLSVKNIRRIYIINQFIRGKCYIIKKTYFYTGLFQSYFALMHQLLFSSFLQFPNYTFNSWLDTCNSINAMLSLILITYITFLSLKLPNKLNKKVFQYKFFFGDINMNYWSLFFRSFQMLKTFSYIFLIVFCMNYPLVQSFLLSAQSALFLFYLLKYQPSKQKLDQFKLILRESMFVLITGLFPAYSFQLNHDQLLLFGWIHIGMIIIIMVGTIITDFYKQFLALHAAYQKDTRIQEIRQEAMYYNNPLQRFVKEDNQIFRQKR